MNKTQEAKKNKPKPKAAAKNVKKEKKLEQAEKNPLEEAYGSMQAIYISESAYKRLNGEEKYGKWYEVCSYATSPSKAFCFKTIVPKAALEDGEFHPDRYEPDAVVEMCERVSDKEIALEVEKNKPKPVSFKKGQTVWIAIHGAGVVSYEEGVVGDIRKGKIWLDNGPGNKPGGPYDAITGKCQGDFGFVMKLHSEKPAGYKPDEE